MAIWENWLRSSPKSSVTAAVTSFQRVRGWRSSGKRKSASAFCTVKPVPRSLGRSYSGARRTVYSLPRHKKVSSTKVGWPGLA